MGIGIAISNLERAMIVHAVAAPVIFGAVFFIYFTYFGFVRPLAAAAAFAGIVIAMDLVVVAGLIQRSLEMFQSVWGTWLPFGLIFAASYAVGRVIRS